MAELVWTGRFEADVQRIYEQLEERQPDAGDGFYRRLLFELQLLETFPQLGSSWNHTPVRRLLVERRRYAVLYTAESRGVLLHTLLDLHEDPIHLERIVRHITQGLRPS